jgi:hypothetical protein
MIIKTAEEKKAIHFRRLDIDYSEFVDDMTHGAHFARFIRQHIRQGIPLKLFTHAESGIHYLNIVENNQTLLYFTDIFNHYQVHDVFYRHECIVDLPHYINFLYYAREIIKSVTFCHYLINENPAYLNLVNKMHDNEFFFKEFIVKGIDSEHGIAVNYTHNDFSIDFLDFGFSVSMNIENSTEMLAFQLKYVDVTNTSKQSGVFYDFHKFVCKINKYIYKTIVEKPMNIPANEFFIEHREIVKMFNI